MKIEVSKSVAKYVLSLNDKREVQRKRSGDGQRWNKVTDPNDCVDGYIYRVDSLVSEEEAREYVNMDEQYKRLEKNLKDFKSRFNKDAGCFRSATDETVYRIKVADKMVQSSTSNRLTIDSVSTAQSVLGSAFNDIFKVKPVEYQITDDMKEVVIAVLNKELLEMTPEDYLDACGLQVSDDCLSRFTSSVRQNAYMLKEELGCDWSAALLWARDIHSCSLYVRLKRLADLHGIAVEAIMDAIRQSVDLVQQDRVTVVTRKE